MIEREEGGEPGFGMAPGKDREIIYISLAGNPVVGLIEVCPACF